MSPLKRFIQKIAGVEFTAAEPIRLRAYGKLPAGMEYVHLDAGEGDAKVFPEWIKAGHDRWIERTARERRGKTRPGRAILALPGLKDQAVCAAIWPSRDSASPPRAFPFSLFAMLHQDILEDPAKLLAVGAQLWSHMDSAFWPIFDGDIPLASLRERTLSSDVGRQTIAPDFWAGELGRIPWEDWARPIARAAGCSDALELAARLERASAQWAGDPSHLALRVPLSGAFDHNAQTAAWLIWLRRMMSSATWKPAGVVLPHPEAAGMQALVVLLRKPTVSDYQLLTTDASACEGVEDLLGTANGKSQQARKLDAPGTLWEWASGASPAG